MNNFFAKKFINNIRRILKKNSYAHIVTVYGNELFPFVHCEESQYKILRNLHNAKLGLETAGVPICELTFSGEITHIFMRTCVFHFYIYVTHPSGRRDRVVLLHFVSRTIIHCAISKLFTIVPCCGIIACA